MLWYFKTGTYTISRVALKEPQMTAKTMEKGVTPEKIMQLGLGFWASKVFLSAVELHVFDALAKAPLSAEELSQQLSLSTRSHLDFLDTLVVLGLLKREHGKYSNGEEAAAYLVSDKPTYIGGFFEMVNRRLYPSWGGLTEALRSGTPQNEAKDTDSKELFSKLYQDPERLRLFLSSMTGISRGPASAIATKFPWKNYKTFADIGTAQGGLASTIAAQHQHLRGVGFDLPEVKPVFEEYALQNGLQDRIKFESGDFFKDELPQVEVIVMGHILHDWNLEEKKMLVRKAFNALPSGGAFVVYDTMIDNDRSQNLTGLLMSLNMLIETPGGFDYTMADCESWMKEAGFKDIHFEPLIGPHTMAVAIKP